MALPAASFYAGGPTVSAGQTALDDTVVVIKQMLGAADESELTIASGSVTATQAQHTIDTEANAASDDLANVLVSSLSAQFVVLRMENSGRIVNLKHEAGGAGQLSLATGADTTLAGTAQQIAFWVDTGASPVTLREMWRGNFFELSPLEVNAAVSGAPNVLTADESGKVFSNEGSAAKNYHTLPTARAGLTFTFIVQDVDGVRVVADSGDTIRIAASESAAAGYIECATIGNAVTLVAVNATEWIATSYVGTWTVA